VGHTDASLTEEGRAQLLQLKEDCCYPAADALFVSPLRRCRETAEILYPGQKSIVLEGLREYDFGAFEDKTPEQLQDHPVFPRWIAGEPGLAPPFGEAPERFQARLTNTFAAMADGLMKTGTARAAVITHGGVVMALLAAFGLPEAAMHEWLTPSGCGFTLRLETSLWLRARKAEVMAMAPEEAADPDALPEERALWLELEETGLV
jgi:alpha-ribazole phosphatase